MHEQQIRAYIVERLTMVIDNNEEWHLAVHEAVDELVDIPFTEDRPKTPRPDLYDAAGEAVRVAVMELIEQDTARYSPVWTLLTDLLDMGDAAQMREVGRAYLPESD